MSWEEKLKKIVEINNSMLNQENETNDLEMELNGLQKTPFDYKNCPSTEEVKVQNVSNFNSNQDEKLNHSPEGSKVSFFKANFY